MPDDQRSLRSVDGGEHCCQLILQACIGRSVVDTGKCQRDRAMTERVSAAVTAAQIDAGNQRPSMRMMSTDETVEPFPDRSLPLHTLMLDSSLASPTANVLRTLEILQNPPGITPMGWPSGDTSSDIM